MACPSSQPNCPNQFSPNTKCLLETDVPWTPGSICPAQPSVLTFPHHWKGQAPRGRQDLVIYNTQYKGKNTRGRGGYHRPVLGCVKRQPCVWWACENRGKVLVKDGHQHMWTPLVLPGKAQSIGCSVPPPNNPTAPGSTQERTHKYPTGACNGTNDQDLGIREVGTNHNYQNALNFW